MRSTSGFFVIPAYNESVHIGGVVSQAIKILPTLVVDDGSTDNTGTIATKEGGQVFVQIPNQGKGEALKRGFKEALNLGCDYVITIDADGQHDVQEAQKFISQYDATQPDLIIGYRNFNHMPIIRRLANTIGRWSFSWAMGMKILDNQSGYRLMSSRLMEKVLESKETGFEFEVEVIVTCVQSNFKIDWVPIKTIYGNEKSHIQPFHHAKNFYRVVFQTRNRMKSKR